MDVVSKQILAHAVSAYETRRYSDAIKYFEALVEYNPNEWQWRWYLAQAYHQSGNLTPARHELTYIVETCPSELMRAKARILLKNVLHDEEEENALPELSMPRLLSWVEHQKGEMR
jgi:tetratricopeptide (TPR) repeat protein